MEDDIEENIEDISLNELNELKRNFDLGVDPFDSSKTYVVNIENCNGLTSDSLERLKSLPVDLKFKLEGDLYNHNSILDAVKYNYSLDQMQQIVAMVEEYGKNMPKEMNEIGRFLYLYRVLCETIKYKANTNINDLDDLSEHNKDRSAYSCLVNGEGVCVGKSLSQKLVMNYYGIDCECISGDAVNSKGESEGAHAWNAVKIDDLWYFSDVTFDTSRPDLLLNCLKNGGDFEKSHQPNSRSENLINGLNFATSDYGMKIIQYMYALYEGTNLPETVSAVKSQQIKRDSLSMEDQLANYKKSSYKFIKIFKNKC